MRRQPFLSWALPYQVGAALLVLCLALGVALGASTLPPLVAAVSVFLAVECAVWSFVLRDAGSSRHHLRRLNAAGFGSRTKARSIYDQETGLCAEWYFLLRLDEEIERSRRSGQPFALLFIEPARELGQRARTRLLHCLGGAFRSADLVGHLGGLRFAALLLEADHEGARTAGARVTSETGEGVKVSGAVYPHDGTDWRTLLAAAGVTWTGAFPDSEPIWTAARRSTFDRRSRDRRNSA